MSPGSGSAKDNTSASVSVPCVPQSPIGVLDAVSFSYKSDDSINGGSSCANSSHNSPEAKRRKLNKTFGG